MTVFDTIRPVYAHLYVHLFMTVYINSSLVLKVTVCVFMNSKKQDDIF